MSVKMTNKELWKMVEDYCEECKVHEVNVNFKKINDGVLNVKLKCEDKEPKVDNIEMIVEVVND